MNKKLISKLLFFKRELYLDKLKPVVLSLYVVDKDQVVLTETETNSTINETNIGVLQEVKIEGKLYLDVRYFKICHFVIFRKFV